MRDSGVKRAREALGKTGSVLIGVTGGLGILDDLNGMTHYEE